MLDPVYRRERLAPGHPRQRLGAGGERQRRPVRQLHQRRPPAGDPGDFDENVAKTEVLAAEDVAPADLPGLGGQQVAERDIVDMRDVEPGIDKDRHPAARRLDDDPPGRGRLDVARPDRGRRVDDDGRQARFRDQLADRELGLEFRRL